MGCAGGGLDRGRFGGDITRHERHDDGRFVGLGQEHHAQAGPLRTVEHLEDEQPALGSVGEDVAVRRLRLDAAVGHDREGAVLRVVHLEGRRELLGLGRRVPDLDVDTHEERAGDGLKDLASVEIGIWVPWTTNCRSFQPTVSPIAAVFGV